MPLPKVDMLYLFCNFFFFFQFSFCFFPGAYRGRINSGPQKESINHLHKEHRPYQSHGEYRTLQVIHSEAVKWIFVDLFQSIEERCEYRPSEENPSVTECHKSAWIDSSVTAFGFAISNFGYQRFKRNSSKASQGFEWVLNSHYGTPATTALSPTAQALLLKKGKLKETAEKAKDLAKAKAAAVSVTTKAW